MSDGHARFDVVRLPKDTARLMDQLVLAAMEYERAAHDDAHKVLCYARKWLAEHIEDLCIAAEVEEHDTDQHIRYL